MSAPEHPPGQTRVEELVELARQAVAPPTPAVIEQGLRRLSTRVGTAESPSGLARARAPRRSRTLRTSLLGAALTGLAAAALLVFVNLRTPPDGALSYRVEGGRVLEGGYLREDGPGAMKLVFGEGTTFALAPGTRGRLRTVDELGARLALEHGTASLEVVPEPRHRWFVEAGPFLVTVQGTAFTVSWDVASERFELRLRQGRVTVSGPLSGGDLSLEAGHKLVVDLPRAETLITELREPDLNAPAPSVGQAPGAPPPNAATAAPAARAASPGEVSVSAAVRSAPHRTAAAASSASSATHHWAEALAAGRTGAILADVERLGTKAAVDASSIEDLFALADAARYERRGGLAREALRATLRRFPHAPRTRDVPYLLGRVEESEPQGGRRALRWYDVYLRSTPRGAYAAEALGRKMILTNDLDGPRLAAPLAEAYLRKFPDGSYAGAARAMQQAP